MNRFGARTGTTLRDMFGIPVVLGATVTVRFATPQFGWLTAKGTITGHDGDRLDVRITQYSRATPDDPNMRPRTVSPLASAVIVVEAPAPINSL